MYFQALQSFSRKLDDEKKGEKNKQMLASAWGDFNEGYITFPLRPQRSSKIASRVKGPGEE